MHSDEHCSSDVRYIDCFMIRFLIICVYIDVFACTRDRYRTYQQEPGPASEPGVFTADTTQFQEWLMSFEL